MDADLFFPDTLEGVRAAQEFCQSCPVCEDCLEFALEHRQDHGVWGGTSERERRRIRTERRQAALSAARSGLTQDPATEPRPEGSKAS